MGNIREELRGGKNGNRVDARSRARESRQRERQHRAAVDMAALPMELLLQVLEAAVAIGGAVRIGVSRDGGAYAFGIYGDGEPYTEYVGASESVEEYLTNLRDYLAAIRD